MTPEIILKLKPAEARALQQALRDALFLLRQRRLPDEQPAFFRRLERVQRLVADGLTYLRQQPSEAAIRTGIPDPPARAE